MKENNRSYKKEKRRMKRWQKIVLAIIGVILVLFTSLFSFAYSKYKKIQRYEVDEKEIENTDLDEETIEVLSGYHIIAVFGVDARNSNTLGKGTLADTNMICSVDYGTGEIRLISVYRDTYLDVTGKESFNKLNYAYAAGGPEQAIKTLNRNLDLNITDFVTLNWKAVADAINILGGIDVEITKSEFAYINGFITETVNSTGVASTHLKAPGLNHLDGVQAVAYSRLRLMDTDYKRTERQRLVISLALEKAKQADLKTLLYLIDAVFPQILTNLDDKEMITIARNINKFYIGVSEGFPFEKTAMRMGSKGDCVIPTQLTNDVSLLHELLFDRENYQPSSVVNRLDMLIKRDAENMRNRPAATTAPPEETYDDETDEEASTYETDENGEPIETTTDEDSGEGTSAGTGSTDEESSSTDSGTETEPSESATTEESSSSETNPSTPEETTTAPEVSPEAVTPISPPTTAPIDVSPLSPLGLGNDEDEAA